MLNTNDCIEYIERMTKSEFHQKILKGVASTGDFSVLVTLGCSAVSINSRERLCRMLADAGVPIVYSTEPDFDKQLEAIANTIAARAVSVS